MIQTVIHSDNRKKIGVLLTHGTDTIAPTFEALRYCVKEPSKPVAMTGAQTSLGETSTHSDAGKNLEVSLKVLTSVSSPHFLFVFNEVKMQETDYHINNRKNRKAVKPKRGQNESTTER